MKVEFQLNLGQLDARRHGLDFTECVEGKVVAVPDDVGDELCNRGIARLVEKTIRAVPPAQGIDQSRPIAAIHEAVKAENARAVEAEPKPEPAKKPGK